MPARIFQINSSPGGVPKRALRAAVVDELGIRGDEHNDKRHHGGPDRALVIYSLEHLLVLQAEGHPIFPGSIGENVTITGLDWAALSPGTRLKLGQIEAQVTGYASPCDTIRGSFADGNFSRVGQKKNPGWSRLTLRILKPGQITVGDLITVES
ncbi:MAG: MOSC domain-containing protein [Candidatus Promineifilaceae bacterium]